MSLPAELVELMNDQVIIAPRTGRTTYNEFTFGTPATRQCYIERTNKKALDRTGRETISTVQVIMADPDTGVGIDDKLTLPDGTMPAIIQVLAAPDENGDPYYLEVRA